jgi:calcineurin-like phosphoesterase family protein
METYTIEEAKRTWFSADLHLNHENIIKYCHRPFESIKQMNLVLIKNWNETICPDNTVFFVGDFCKGDPRRWLGQLNGKITFIRGSHDRRLNGLTIPYYTLQVGEGTLLLIHNPRHAPWNFDGWVVHGHYHNSDLRCHPLINHRSRRVNISVELTGYKPISLYEILEAIKDA